MAAAVVADDLSTCQNYGCKVSGDSKSMGAHATSCDLRPMKCQYCKLVRPNNEMKEHLDMCLNFTSKCRYCGHTMTMQKFVDEHYTGCAEKYSSPFKMWEAMIGIDEMIQVKCEIKDELQEAEGSSGYCFSWLHRFPYTEDVALQILAVKQLRRDWHDVRKLVLKSKKITYILTH
ncbi:MAG: hypothetical protein Hyperionvirus1_21 [Hyperionvirus sp.]|uniref:TRAF-type domain-containing protein n=1 Tax=Hyperionvirus sp. TaxID=2487770 RepID=A0A3G5A5Z5_9VIRU|nr:MAG: hypothetical protein Hyperionvirus1_21 [Hyperionvirus sp.]